MIKACGQSDEVMVYVFANAAEVWWRGIEGKLVRSANLSVWRIPAEAHGLSEEPLLLSLGNTFENAFVVVQQFRWAFGEFTPASHLWFTKDKKYFEATDERRRNIRANLEDADVAVVTLGMSEVWYDRLDGEVLWRSIPARLYDPERHVFKVTTVEETTAALHELHRIVARFLPRLQGVPP